MGYSNRSDHSGLLLVTNVTYSEKVQILSRKSYYHIHLNNHWNKITSVRVVSIEIVTIYLGENNGYYRLYRPRDWMLKSMEHNQAGKRTCESDKNNHSRDEKPPQRWAGIPPIRQHDGQSNRCYQPLTSGFHLAMCEQTKAHISGRIRMRSSHEHMCPYRWIRVAKTVRTTATI